MPLMISILATLLMVFVDRCFLARYSLEALNASVSSGTLAWAFLGGICTLTAMSEVFVSQYNGANEKAKIGIPVWQMIWVSVASFALFIPLSLCGDVFFGLNPENIDLQTSYFRTLILFGPSYALIPAFSGFYIGRGKTKLLIGLAFAANILNAVLDWAFIFGIPGIVPEMGIFGAAVATGIGASSQSLILAILFFRKKNREKYGTMNWRFNLDVCKKCLRVGVPPALYIFLEIVGWAFFYMMMTSMGKEYITISGICQSLIILLSFYYEGLSRGVVAVAGNFIGAKRYEYINKVIKSGIFLQMVFAIGVTFFIGYFPDLILQFFGGNEILQEAPVSASLVVMSPALKSCLLLSAAYMLFEGLRWIYSGVLTAAGDTFFILVMGAISVWVFLLLPLYFIVVKGQLPVEAAWILTAAFSFLLCLFFWMRYRTDKWREINLLEEDSSDLDVEPEDS